MSTPRASQDDIRQHNRALLLRLLHVRGAQTRSDLGLHTGLNRSTIGLLTTELVSLGLAVEAHPEPDGGVGRPSIMVAPAQSTVYVVAVDFRVDRTVTAAVGLGGRVLLRRESPHRRGGVAERTAVRQLADLAEEMQQELSGARCVGMGVGVPGVVRHSDGLVRFAPNLGWVDMPLGSRLTQAMRGAFPVVIGNDADSGAIAEHVRGAAVQADNVIYLSGSVGVGGGILLDGQLLKGAGGYGGEVGHTRVNPRGRICRCGARGCWETEIGEEAILLATGLDRGQDSLSETITAAAAGDRHSRAGLRRVGTWLGVGVSNLVNLFNPDVVVFGGTLRTLFPATRDQVTAELDHALAAPRQQVSLKLPGLEGDSTLLGAAESAFEPLLSDPVGTVQSLAQAG